MTLRSLIPLLCTSFVAAHGYAAEPAKIELHVIQTMTLTDEQFLTGSRDGQPATIAGELRLPVGGTSRLPALVIVHGSGGFIQKDDRWLRELNDIGVATFLLDGFTGRGIINATTDQSKLGNLTMINDAYRALDLLAQHPRIDPKRIGIFGGSRGGVITLYSSLRRFQRTYASPGTEFVVYIPFYAGCNRTLIDDTDVADRPIRIFHGTADDTALIGPCRGYVERLKRAGKNVQLTEYDGAHHGFDNPGSPPRLLPQAQTPASCLLDEKPMGRLVNRDTGLPFTLNDSCVRRGATAGYDPAAHAQSIKAVKSLLQQVFGLESTQ